MVGKYRVITLCGSTRFKDAFMETQKRLTLGGNIVISVLLLLAVVALLFDSSISGTARRMRLHR